MGCLIHVTAWERISPWRRIPCALGRVVLLLALLTGLGALLGPPLTTFFTVKWWAKKIPGLNVVPEPLKDYSVSDAPGTTLSYFGYSFEVPWNASFKVKEGPKNTSTSGVAGVNFASGQDLLVLASDDQTGLLSKIVHDPSLHMENLGPLFGDLIKRSAYDQYSDLLNTTPSTVRAFGPRAEAVRGQMLLTIKAIAFPSSLETGVFSFQFPNKRGFQIGDPRKSRRADLEILDLDGNRVEIICSASQDGVRLTQPELNRILKSLRAVPAHPVTVSATTAPQN
jgi:hypothetical protein